MKKIISLLFSLFVLINLTTAQVPDSDGDGINDREDVCPNVAGTKANKGCPEIKTPKNTSVKKENVLSTKNKSVTKPSSNTKTVPVTVKPATATEFIKTDIFNKLFTAITTNKLNTIASNQKDGEHTISNLGLIGKKNSLPILFKTYPNNTAEVFCILSESKSDLEVATNEILNKLNASNFNYGAFKSIQINKLKDTNVLIIAPKVGNKYYEMAVVIPPGSNFVALVVFDYNRVITKEEVANYSATFAPDTKKKTETKPKETFCDQLNYLLKQRLNSFANLEDDLEEEPKEESGYLVAHFIYKLIGFYESGEVLSLYNKTDKNSRVIVIKSNIYFFKEESQAAFNKIAEQIKLCKPELQTDEKLVYNLPMLSFYNKNNPKEKICYLVFEKVENNIYRFNLKITYAN